MTELQQNRYDQLLRRTGGLIGAGSMVNDALTELFPTIDVETLNAELALPLNWRLGFAGILSPASVGNVNHVQLFNPADSGAIVVLERVDLRADLDMVIEYALATTGLTNLTANHALRDTREGILVQPIAQVRDVQQVGSLPQFGILFGEANVNTTMHDKRGLFVLAPGTGVTFGTTIGNQTSQVSFQWRERVAERSELNFP